MGPLSVVYVHSELHGPIVGAFSVSEKGGETLPGAAYIELYRTRQAISTRSNEGRLWNRILEVVGIADRSVRSS